MIKDLILGEIYNMENIINRIANLEYDLFVANPHAIAIQQNDGRYVEYSAI